MNYESSGEVRFYGQRDALEASDLVPRGTPFPGEVPGARGIRWKDEAGRRHVLSRFRRASNTFLLTVYSTTAEKKQQAEAARVGTELAKIERELARLEVPSEDFRAQAWRIMYMSSFATKQLMFGGEEGWCYDAAVEDEFYEVMGRLHQLIQESPVSRNEAALSVVRRKRAALTDDKFRRSMLKLVTGNVS